MKKNKPEKEKLWCVCMHYMLFCAMNNGPDAKCENCRYRSDEFTSVCTNSDSPRCADFVDAENTCLQYERKD